MKPRSRKLIWFFGIYLGSVCALGVVTVLIRVVLRLLTSLAKGLTMIKLNR